MRNDTDGLLTSNVLRFGNVMKADGRSKTTIVEGGLRGKDVKSTGLGGAVVSSFANFRVCAGPKLADKIRVGELPTVWMYARSKAIPYLAKTTMKTCGPILSPIIVTALLYFVSEPATLQ